MNAKIILVAVAAICCFQGIAAASVARPLPWAEQQQMFELDLDQFDLDNLDVDAVLDNLVMTLEKMSAQAFEVSNSNHKLGAPRNIFTCITALTSVFKEAKEVKQLVDEFSKIKKDLNDAKEACKTPTAPETTDDCNEKATKAYEVAHAAAKGKILPTVIKSLTTLFSLKACLSIV
ncbi:hypothetical protein FOCC_FOCC008248 [Frankliniella occidentalis]|uniref:Uncharacterized protein LOC113210902 isoform X1 n=1 Tax=Frankliniella occidentalis TaxID=133901 RepID=A0A6J1SVH3_FRAOC|nr:uncharacterized protein LOC113210902 isoform X1 [Frankliniella occidentalis]XP_052125145.1 uncharacterized protein LOC113210902 isoform X1 [Frankliniella occidentalis]KAE8745073.1 hypothetical protein FOCC_FOCC008248 [Frankliniella occidentalis]